MAKLCMFERQEKKTKLIKKYAKKREQLKEVIYDMSKSPEEREQAVFQLANLPRSSSKTRLKNRCRMTGRARGYLRKFDLCRNKFRELASSGLIPGVTKSSW